MFLVCACYNVEMGTEESLNGSQLGTKEYWDTAYLEEFDNYSDNGDFGEIWFGENVVKRVTNWLDNVCPTLTSCNRNASILDIGTGNGMFLIELSKLSFINLTGVDYSESAIKLAKEIGSKHNAAITYEVGNLLELEHSRCSVLTKTYDICTDKGTFDAISLDPDDAVTKKRVYVKRVFDLLNIGSLFVITSCNWTKDELLVQFSDYFDFVDEIPMRQYHFGGKMGQQVTSIVFKKKLKLS